MADKPSDTSPRDKNALIILFLYTSISGTWTPAICLFDLNIYDCNFLLRKLRDNEEITEKVYLPEPSNDDHEFYIEKNNIKKAISIWAITHYSSAEGITAFVNGKQYVGNLMMDNYSCFKVFKVKISTEDVFGDKHYCMHNIEEIKQWPDTGNASARSISPAKDSEMSQSKGGKFNWYTQNMQSRIEDNFKPPMGLSDKQETYVVVTFTVFENGEISDVAISQSSGISTLDNYAIAAVKKAAPFGKLPATFTGKQLKPTVTLYYVKQQE
jgi:TonB family protein